MGKITGLEAIQEIPEKVLAAYEAVRQLIEEGRDVSEIPVSAITDRAGIGKGTIYDYFDSKEEIIACSFLFHLQNVSKKMTESVSGLDSFRKQLEYLFDILDKDSKRKACFVRFIHGATDNSRYSQMIREKLMESNVGHRFPEYLMGPVVRQAVERGEVNPQLPVNYLVYAIFCKILTYRMRIAT